MDLEERCMLFQESAVKAAHLTGHNVHLNKSRSFATCKSVRKLRTRCIKLESSITRRLLWANSHFPKWQSDKNEAEELRIRFRDRVRQKKADKRLKWRLATKVNSKQFWVLVRRAERKRGSLSAIRDANGNIITNRELVEQIVLEQLALIFSGKRSPIFSHRNEQIIKESQVKSE